MKENGKSLLFSNYDHISFVYLSSFI